MIQSAVFRIACIPFSGGHGAGETPVPIPNTAVKTRRGDGTASLGGGRVARCQIFSSRETPGGHPPHSPPRASPFFALRAPGWRAEAQVTSDE